uniref:Ig-like domain-containing protein n=1 Tax=Strigamia maritima TaxID=126957 RepID=T1JJ84_STRMM
AAPVLHQVFSENTLHPGPSLSLQCAASGNPTPEISWTLDGQPIPESKRFQISDQSVSAGDMVSQVNITRLKVEDGGDYKCIATNRVGTAQHIARLNVFGIPYIRPMPNVTIVAGRDVTIPCRVAGHPIRLIRWERDGMPFPANLRHKAYPNGTLVIHKAELVADRGSYTCVASSEYGQTARRSVWVNIMACVKHRPFTYVDPPKIEPFSFPRDLSEDMRARVLCTIIRGDLPITITWMKDYFHLSLDLGIVVHNADEFSSSLTFRSVTATHRGNYTCIASNAASTVNYTAELFVHVPPRWSVEPSDTQIMAGTTAVLDCQAEGFPAPNVTWMFGGGKFYFKITNKYMNIEW